MKKIIILLFTLLTIEKIYCQNNYSLYFNKEYYINSNDSIPLYKYNSISIFDTNLINEYNPINYINKKDVFYKLEPFLNDHFDYIIYKNEPYWYSDYDKGYIDDICNKIVNKKLFPNIQIDLLYNDDYLNYHYVHPEFGEILYSAEYFFKIKKDCLSLIKKKYDNIFDILNDIEKYKTINKNYYKKLFTIYSNIKSNKLNAKITFQASNIQNQIKKPLLNLFNKMLFNYFNKKININKFVKIYKIDINNYVLEITLFNDEPEISTKGGRIFYEYRIKRKVVFVCETKLNSISNKLILDSKDLTRFDDSFSRYTFISKVDIENDGIFELLLHYNRELTQSYQIWKYDNNVWFPIMKKTTYVE